MVVLNNVLTYILEKNQRKMPQLSIFLPSLLLLGWSPRDCIYDRFHPAETSSYTSRSLRPENNGMEGLIQRCAARRQWQKYKPNKIPVTSTKRHFFWEGAEKCLVNFTFNCWEEVHSDS